MNPWTLSRSPMPRVGDRIRLIAMPDDPDPIPKGTQGTVIELMNCEDRTHPFAQIDVRWDIARRLFLCPAVDEWEIVETSESEAPVFWWV